MALFHPGGELQLATLLGVLTNQISWNRDYEYFYPRCASHLKARNFLGGFFCVCGWLVSAQL